MMLHMDLTTAPILDHPAAGPGAMSRPAAGPDLASLLADPTGDLAGDPAGTARERRPGYDAGAPDDDDRPADAVGGSADAVGGSADAAGGSADAAGGSAGAPSTGAQQVAAAVASIVAVDPLHRQVDGELSELVDTLRAVDRLSARAVRLAGQLDARCAAAEEGMTVDGALRLHTGTAGPDVSMVLTAADVLRTMPAAGVLFARGVFSWGHVRQLVVRTRRFDVPTRTRLDDHLGANADQLAAMDPERRGWAIEDACDDHQPERTLERRAERAEQTEFLSAQGRLDGSGHVYAEYGPEGFATITDRLQAEADTPRAQPCPGDRDGPDEPVPTRGQQLAAALLRLLGRNGSEGGSGPVRFTVTVDVDRITDTAAGTVQTAVRGRPPRLVRRALDRIACDAALDVVIRDGVDLLAAQRYAPEVTAAVRRAVTSRDQGCRFPGCTAPPSWCDVHHVEPRATGDDHAVTNLVLLCRRHHTTIHRRGWHQTLQPDGTYTIRRRSRTWTTLPRRGQLLPPPDRNGPTRRGVPPDGPAPPIHPRPRPDDIPF
jgi:hypothetical protein